MDILEISGENIDTLLAQKGILIVDAWAAWCGPCRTFAPVFEKTAAAHADHTFGKLDTQSNMDLVADLGIQQIPTLLIYRDGILVYREAGSPKAEVLNDLISQVEELDMDKVKADISAQKTAETEEDQV